MNALAILMNRWTREKLMLLPPETDSRIEAAFAKVGSKTSTEIRTLYRSIGGMEVMDNEFWRLWSLEQIVQENIEISEYGVLFSDYLIDSWCFRLKVVGTERTEVYLDYFDNTPPIKVALSLVDFFASCVQHPAWVLDPTYAKVAGR